MDQTVKILLTIYVYFTVVIRRNLREIQSVINDVVITETVLLCLASVLEYVSPK